MRATTLPTILGVALGMSLITSPVPTSAVAPAQSSAVRDLKVKVLNKQCVRVTWRAPATGKAFYKLKVGGANMPYASFRTATSKRKVRVCGLEPNAYTAFVRPMGGPVRYVVFEVGNPQLP